MVGRVKMLIAAGLAALSALGCGQGPRETTVRIVHHRAAALEVPASIRRVGVAAFGGVGGDQGRWGRVLADEVAALLREAPGRYAVLGPAEMASFLPEGAPRPLGPDSARRLGKRAALDAVLYGSLAAGVSETSPHHPETAPGVRSNSERPAGRTAWCRVKARFAMDEVATGRTLAAAVLTRDARLPHRGPAGAEAAVRELLTRCAAEFVAMTRASVVDFVIVLDAGDDKNVTAGNALARDGRYDAALARYEAALAREPRDAGAAFNAGVMYEKNRLYARALAMYDKALSLVPLNKYRHARDRLAGRDAPERFPVAAARPPGQ